MIDEELKEELRKEIRAIIKDEIINVLFQKKFKDSVKSYVNVIINDEIKNRKLKDNFLSTTYEIDENVQIQRRNTFSINTDLLNSEIYTKLLEEKKIDTSFEDFVSALTSKQSEKYINWIDKVKRSRQYQVLTIFTFLDEISSTDLKNLNTYNRKKLINFIVERFLKNSMSMLYHNVNKAYGDWVTK